MSVLIIGTCRVQEAASILVNEGAKVDYMRHRTHTIEQAEWLLKGFSGANTHLQKVEHTISDRAVKFIREGKLDRVRGEVRRLRGLQDSFKGYIIEISSKKNFYCPDENNRVRMVNTFFTKDCPPNTPFIHELVKKGELLNVDASACKMVVSNKDQTIDAMKRVKTFLKNKPILWVGPTNLVESQMNNVHLFESRKGLSDTIREGSLQLSDSFFDPTDLVKAFGEKNFFAENGTDFDHFSQFGIDLVQKRIEVFLASL